MKKPDRIDLLRGYMEGTGHALALAGTTLAALPHLWRRRRDFLDQLFGASVANLPVVSLVATFTGMILSLQVGLALADLGQESSIGSIVAAALVREMGPLITAIILSAAIASAQSAELGSMAINEEITALEVMSIDPVKYLVLPRVIALTIACPALTLISDVLGILGGGVIAQSVMEVDYLRYMDTVIEALNNPDRTTETLPKDLYAGLFKATVFGFVIGVVGCSRGLRTTGGALGVGAAARASVRNSIILILVLSYMLTRLMYS
ncbi:MAG: ABC transporter permease [Planctomycetes bacterium]|nr:ABC transporter permease [Planctomycetota bacterium]